MVIYDGNGDPYVYPGTKVLINRFGIKDLDTLLMREAYFSRIRYEQKIPDGNFDYSHYKAIHHHLFQDMYEWAGEPRIINISKGGSLFAFVGAIDSSMNTILNKMLQNKKNVISIPMFSKHIAYYFSEINAVHPFREGNGRTLRTFLDCYCKKNGFKVNWTSIDRTKYIQASIFSFRGDNSLLEQIFLETMISFSSRKMPRLTLK